VDPATAETLAGALETRPQMPAPLPPADASAPLRDRILAVVALYGWLSTEAFEQVADATRFTPALCKSVASFYDMFRLHPAGKHEICVCTNISCALVGAGETLREFSRELGIEPGATTADGMFTLRSVECYGGCGWGPVVSVDERYHEPFGPDRVKPLLAGLRGEAG
jgi:NADH-quinone oxidoreductase subunit E